MLIDFPGGARVDAHFNGFTVRTDQGPQGGGEASAPTPFDLFLASLGTCAGIYVLGFCRQRGLPTEGIQLRERVLRNPETRKLEAVEIDIEVPPTFPEKYHEALVRAAAQCAVKKQLEAPPAIQVATKVRG
ncbi:MAG: OsmC family protein [Acidobacteria bacterium]|nr:OsmC family protein [Acidobacteriota bacterium]